MPHVFPSQANPVLFALVLDSPAASGVLVFAAQKRGAEKISFGVRDVRALKVSPEANGLKFGVVHEAGGFEFSNAEDPAGNSIQISNRGLK